MNTENLKTMTLGSLFDGISGFPLAAQWAGIETKWLSEIDPFCLKISQKNFPNVKQYGDIKEISYPERVDIISGGFPCQPFSVAGKRKGTSDDRYLWPEMLRVIREVKPTWVVGENVTGIINMELENVLTSLENEGYTTETFIVPACAVNAPHRRDRVWVVSWNTKGNGNNSIDQIQERKKANSNRICHATDTNSKRCEEFNSSSFANKQGFNNRESINHWRDWPTQSPVCRRNDGISNRVERIKALGNAIVPQVAYEIFKAIIKIESNK